MAVPRSRSLSTKVTEDEYATFENLAGDQSISEWARDILLHARTRSTTEQILLAEVLALRTILLNLHFAVAQWCTADGLRRFDHHPLFQPLDVLVRDRVQAFVTYERYQVHAQQHFLCSDAAAFVGLLARVRR